MRFSPSLSLSLSVSAQVYEKPLEDLKTIRSLKSKRKRQAERSLQALMEKFNQIKNMQTTPSAAPATEGERVAPTNPYLKPPRPAAATKPVPTPLPQDLVRRIMPEAPLEGDGEVKPALRPVGEVLEDSERTRKRLRADRILSLRHAGVVEKLEGEPGDEETNTAEMEGELANALEGEGSMEDENSMLDIEGHS
jgi:DNA-binding protein H-NS